MRSQVKDPHARITRYRVKMASAGMRAIQIWVPDTRLPGFALECHRQSLMAAAADQNDAGLNRFMDEALTDLEDGGI